MEMEIDYSDFCSTCGSDIFPETLKLTGTKCAGCRDMVAKEARSFWCVAPLHKSNYMLITDPADLAGLNNKGGLVT